MCWGLDTENANNRIFDQICSGMQALWEWVVLLPVTVAQASRPRQDMGVWGWIGFLIYMLLFLIETGGFVPPLSCLLL